MTAEPSERLPAPGAVPAEGGVGDPHPAAEVPSENHARFLTGICLCGCDRPVSPGRRGEAKRFATEACRLRFHREARRLGAQTLLRRHRRRNGGSPDPQKVAAVVAWAEARKPADVAAWRDGAALPPNAEPAVAGTPPPRYYDRVFGSVHEWAKARAEESLNSAPPRRFRGRQGTEPPRTAHPAGCGAEGGAGTC